MKIYGVELMGAQKYACQIMNYICYIWLMGVDCSVTALVPSTNTFYCH